MVAESTTPTEIEGICERNGVVVREVTTVRDGVYRALTEDARFDTAEKVFLKVYPQEKREELRRFVDIATDTGHPECVLVDDEPLLLVMAAADGRPLARLLPVVFLPGLWQVFNEKYVRAHQQIGEQLGRLHAETESGHGPVLTADERARGIRLTRHVDGTVGDSIVMGIQSLFEEAAEVTPEYALTYGDRSPHNMYFDGQRVTQIDCNCSRRPVSYEHVGVVMGIRLMCRRLPYAREKIARSLEDAYWKGYQQIRPDTDPNQNALSIRYIYRCLKLLDLYGSNPTSLNSKLTKRVDKPILADEIRDTYKTLSTGPGPDS